jgi:hypothetical protein
MRLSVRSYNLEYQYSGTIPKRTQLVSLQEQIGDKYLPKMKFSWKRFGYVEPTRWSILLVPLI